MKLSLKSLQTDRAAYLKAGFHLPEFDYDKVRHDTLSHPVWLHFGPGNLFKAFPAHAVQNLLNSGVMGTGLIAAEGYDYEIVEKASRPHDNLTVLAILTADGTVEKTVIASIMETLILDSKNQPEFNRLKEIFASPSLQLVSFTITEKGYSSEDYLGKVAALLYHRYQSGALPLAMVSLDNCSHNGDLLRDAMWTFADNWCGKGLTEQGFADYVKNPEKVSFPWTMIDKITPRPDSRVEELLAADGMEDLSPVITSKKSYVAPFVNAEESEYLIIEDLFPAGRPPLEAAGFWFVPRETVDKMEKMKVCTCLNPLHTALAVFGCLLGFSLIADEMRDPILQSLVRGLGYREGLPVVTHPGIMEPEKFLDTVIGFRLPNPFLPDTPQRIAADTSQKLAVRFGETIKSYAASPALDPKNLVCIPLVFAGWLRYLMGVDDSGAAFEPSPDPLLSSLQSYVKDYSLSRDAKDLSRLDGLLSNEKIFGVHLGNAGLSGKVKQYFAEMSSGIGAVRSTLEKYTKGM